MRETLDCFMQH